MRDVFCSESARVVSVEIIEHRPESLVKLIRIHEVFGVQGGGQEFIVVENFVSVVVHFVDDGLDSLRGDLVVLVPFHRLHQLVLLDHAVAVQVDLLKLPLEFGNVLMGQRLDKHVHGSLLKDGLPLED